MTHYSSFFFIHHFSSYVQFHMMLRKSLLFTQFLIALKQTWCVQQAWHQERSTALIPSSNFKLKCRIARLKCWECSWLVIWLFSAIIFCFSVVFLAHGFMPRSWKHICCNRNTLNDSGKKCPNIFSTYTWSTFSHKLIFSHCEANIAQISFKVGKKSNWIFFC